MTSGRSPLELTREGILAFRRRVCGPSTSASRSARPPSGGRPSPDCRTACRERATRLLPSGDTYFLLQGADREFLVPDPALRSVLWTSRVWPGAVLLTGDLVGTWRRAGAVVTVESSRRLSRAERESVEAEAASIPLPGIDQPIVVRWRDVELR